MQTTEQIAAKLNKPVDELTNTEVNQARHEAHMRQLRAEFEKLWQEKLLPVMERTWPKDDQLSHKAMCWLAFKEGR